MRDTKECRLPVDPGLMVMQWEVMDMQKYIDNLDDFEDDSRPPIVDWVEWLLVGIFDLAGAGACAYIGYLLLVLVVEGRWIG